MHLPGVQRAQGQMETRPHLATSAPRVLYVFVNKACAYLGMWWDLRGSWRGQYSNSYRLILGALCVEAN